MDDLGVPIFLETPMFYQQVSHVILEVYMTTIAVRYLIVPRYNVGGVGPPTGYKWGNGGGPGPLLMVL